MTTLHLHIDNIVSTNAIEFLRYMIDLSNLYELMLKFDLNEISNPKTIILLAALFKETSHIKSLLLVDQWSHYVNIANVTHLYTIIPTQLNYFQTNFLTIVDLDLILQRVKNLTSLTIVSPNETNRFTEVLAWFTEKDIDFTYKKSISSLFIWFCQSFSNSSIHVDDQ